MEQVSYKGTWGPPGCSKSLTEVLQWIKSAMTCRVASDALKCQVEREGLKMAI